MSPSTLLPPCRAKRAEFDPLCYLGPILTRPQPEDGASFPWGKYGSREKFSLWQLQTFPIRTNNFGKWSEHERSAWLAANGSIHHRAYCGARVTP